MYGDEYDMCALPRLIAKHLTRIHFHAHATIIGQATTLMTPSLEAIHIFDLMRKGLAVLAYASILHLSRAKVRFRNLCVNRLVT